MYSKLDLKHHASNDGNLLILKSQDSLEKTLYERELERDRVLSDSRCLRDRQFLVRRRGTITSSGGVTVLTQHHSLGFSRKISNESMEGNNNCPYQIVV